MGSVGRKSNGIHECAGPGPDEHRRMLVIRSQVLDNSRRYCWRTAALRAAVNVTKLRETDMTPRPAPTSAPSSRSSSSRRRRRVSLGRSSVLLACAVLGVTATGAEARILTRRAPPPSVVETTTSTSTSTTSSTTTTTTAPAATTTVPFNPVVCRNKLQLLAQLERQKAKALTLLARADGRARRPGVKADAALQAALEEEVAVNRERVDALTAQINVLRLRCP